MIPQSYITVRSSASDEIVIQKSRFIGYASPCETEEDAQAMIRSLREQHHDARHHCYAYIIGKNSGIMRYSDDGEPGGTAGMPMMDVLKKKQVVNCCVVVVRYFGGILLGTGGLVRAYTESCKIALDAAGLILMESVSVRRCEVPYSAWDQIQYAIKNLPARLDSVEYSQHVSFRLYARAEDMTHVLDQLQTRTGRLLSCQEEADRYAEWEHA